MKLFKFFIGALFVVSMASCSGKKEAQTVGEVVSAEETPAVITLAQDATIGSADGKLVVIDFNATWCGPCKMFAPNFEKVAEQNRDKAVFYSVDVDIHPELAAKYQVQGIPMVVFIKPDGTYTSSVGYLEADQFEALLKEQL